MATLVNDRRGGADFSLIFAEEQSNETVLSVSGATVTFGGLTAVRDVSFDLGGTDVLAIIGPNGAGKSTMLNAISGLVPLHSGQIRCAGTEIGGLSAWRVAACGVGRGFQDPVLVEELSVLQNVLVGAHRCIDYGLFHQLLFSRRVRREEERFIERALQVLDFFGLHDQALEPARSLPYGSRKLVDIARAMVSGPRVLLLDEPSSGLDRVERKALEQALLALRGERRVAIVVVEHHMDLVRAVASHVLVLQAGAKTMSGDAAEVLDSVAAREVLAGGHVTTVDEVKLERMETTA